jgi:hypothetical protein
VTGESIQRPIDRSLEAARDLDVFDSTAARTDQVVMVLRQPFGQLIAAEHLVGDHPLDHPRVFENRKVSICTALRRWTPTFEELRDRERSIGGAEGVHEPATSGCVALADVAEPSIHALV